MKKFMAVAITGVMTIGLATPLLADDMLMGADAIAKRQELMKSNGGTMRNAGGASGADAVAAAQTLVDNFTQLADLWPSDSMEGDTKAKPEIWNEDGSLSVEFLGDLMKATEAANSVLVAAQHGDTQAYGDALKALGGTCGACHQPFRAQ